MAAVARSVGIPIRIAGCSQSIPDDDHHWTEFYDDKSSSGQFGDSWHTKEGVSKGNEGGPWDAPSTSYCSFISQEIQSNKRTHTHTQDP